MKIKMDPYELCKDYPKEFPQILEYPHSYIILRYVKTLSFKTDPDYNFICNKFLKAADNSKIEIDGIYDWTEQSTKIKKIQTIETKNDFGKQSSLQPPQQEKNNKTIERQTSNKNLMGLRMHLSLF